MNPPRKRTGRLALLLVVVTVGITSPLLTIFATTLVDASQGNPNQLISLLGGQYGGTVLEIEVAVAAYPRIWRPGHPLHQRVAYSSEWVMKAGTRIASLTEMGSNDGIRRYLASFASRAFLAVLKCVDVE
jgi:hypothetical protein